MLFGERCPRRIVGAPAQPRVQFTATVNHTGNLISKVCEHPHYHMMASQPPHLPSGNGRCPKHTALLLSSLLTFRNYSRVFCTRVRPYRAHSIEYTTTHATYVMRRIVGGSVEHGTVEECRRCETKRRGHVFQLSWMTTPKMNVEFYMK